MLMCGVGQRNFLVFFVYCAPHSHPQGYRLPCQGPGVKHGALSAEKEKKTILKYPSACPLWEFRIMWLSRTYEINLPTSPGGRQRPFARALCMTGSSGLQWDTVGGQGQSEGHIKIFGGYRLLHGLFPWPRPFECQGTH